MIFRTNCFPLYPYRRLNVLNKCADLMTEKINKVGKKEAILRGNMNPDVVTNKLLDVILLRYKNISHI